MSISNVSRALQLSLLTVDFLSLNVDLIIYTDIWIRTFCVQAGEMAYYKDSLHVPNELLNLCRICGKANEDMRNLFKTSTARVSMAERLQTCLKKPVSEIDGLPPNICTNCISVLFIAYEFQIRCMNSEKKFHEIRSKHTVHGGKKDVDESPGTDVIIKIEECDECENNDVAIKTEKVDESDEMISILWVSSGEEDEIALNVEKSEQKTYASTAIFECYRCKCQFDRLFRLETHLNSCKPKPHQCSVCAERFTCRRMLLKHKRELNHKSEEEISTEKSAFPFECWICSKRYASKLGLNSHNKQTHHKAEDQFFAKGNTQNQCEYCETSCETSYALLKHIRSHENINEYECDYCSKKYLLKSPLAKHVWKCAGVTEHVCDVCSKTFSKLELLKQHVKIHASEPSFLCSECGKAFKTIGNLGTHLKWHTEKKYACNECPARYNRSQDLLSHKRSHTGERKFSCDKCPARFRTGYTFIRHKQRHAGDRRYACPMCDKRFYATGHLKTHIRTHTGEKPFKCEFCDRAYAQKGDLTKHRRIKHVGDSVYHCVFCSNAFRFQADLRGHLFDHYKEQKNRINGEDDEVESEKLAQIEQEWRKYGQYNGI